jgi:pimeloyl-ACP methyl ester carboxylesterase
MSIGAANQVIFSHGKDSEPWGTKIVALAETARALGWQVESVDYRGLDSVEARLEKLLHVSRSLPPAVHVGSSLGGFLAAAASLPAAARGLFLMAPAFELPGLPPTPAVAGCPMVVVHGWQDDIVPVDIGISFARRHAATLQVLDDDHRLHHSLPFIRESLAQFLRRFA